MTPRKIRTTCVSTGDRGVGLPVVATAASRSARPSPSRERKARADRRSRCRAPAFAQNTCVLRAWMPARCVESSPPRLACCARCLRGLSTDISVPTEHSRAATPPVRSSARNTAVDSASASSEGLYTLRPSVRPHVRGTHGVCIACCAAKQSRAARLEIDAAP